MTVGMYLGLEVWVDLVVADRDTGLRVVGLERLIRGMPDRLGQITHLEAVVVRPRRVARLLPRMEELVDRVSGMTFRDRMSNMRVVAVAVTTRDTGHQLRELVVLVAVDRARIRERLDPGLPTQVAEVVGWRLRPGQVELVDRES